MKHCQQDALYAAEERIDRGGLFGSIEEIQQFVDDLRDTHWWHAQGYWTVERVEVGRPSARNEKGGSVGWYDEDMNAGRIEMAKCHWSELFVLHELAHVLAEAKHHSESHDPWFARIYLTLVSCVMGADHYLLLQHVFDEAGVRYDGDSPRTGIAL